MSAKCPICSKPVVPEHAPFCSRRCADVDLHRWLAGRYAIPAAEADTPDDEDAADGRTD
jgi:endogenous inhibitor of DNA gyrase (YacG/DUF329 family)